MNTGGALKLMTPEVLPSTGSAASLRDNWSYWKKPAIVGIVVLQVGTGGAATLEYYRDRAATGYQVGSYIAARPANEAARVAPLLSLNWNIDQLRSLLGASVTDVSRALSVSRQAIYDWQAGSSVSQDNQEKLARLAEAAEIFAASEVPSIQQLTRRQISGRNFFDRVRDGEGPKDVAADLVAIAKREQEQRARLEARLAGRISKPDIDDFGVPHVAEEG